jgi:hypothetical protein
MRRACVLLLLVSCGKAAPVDDLSWRGKPDVLAEFSNRNNYPISTREAVIRGKLLVIDMTGQPAFDGYLNQRLPAELKPHRKVDVGTIAWIRHIRTAAGKYSGGHVGVQESYEITIVDNIDKQAIWTNVIQGPPPNKEVTYRKSEKEEIDRNGISGGYPTEAVVRYLLQLPRR